MTAGPAIPELRFQKIEIDRLVMNWV